MENIELTQDQQQALKNLTDTAFAYWTMLNSGLRSAQLHKDIPSVIKFTNEVKIAHNTVREGLNLCKFFGVPVSFEVQGDLGSKPKDTPLDDSMPPPLIIKPGE